MMIEGAAVSTACTDWIATALLLLFRSCATFAATSTVMLALLSASGVITRVYSVAETVVNVPLVPPLIVISPAVKPVTASSNVKV